MNENALTFQDMILALEHYWADKGCTVMQPYDSEVGAGTFHTATTLRSARSRGLAHLLPAALPPPRRRPLRREPQPHAALLPVPGDPEALPRLTLRTSTSAPSRPSASTRPSTTSASSRTTGRARRWAPGALAGRSGWTAWRSPSTPTSSRSAASRSTRSRSRSPTASSASPCTSRASTLSTTSIWSYLPDGTPMTYGDVFHENEVRVLRLQLRGRQRRDDAAEVRRLRGASATPAWSVSCRCRPTTAS